MRALCLWSVALTWTGCSDSEEFRNDPVGNFEALWSILDRQYCYFAEKGIDWDEVHDRYRNRLTPSSSDGELFAVCAEMINELKDGHVNLTTPFTSTYYRAWWSDYPANFRWRTVQENYLGFNYYQISGISYAIFVRGDDTSPRPRHAGYMYYPSFSTTVSEGALDYIMAAFSECDGLIIDIRDNGGGMLTNIDSFVGRFIDAPVCGGWIRHKTGPGHDEFSDPYEIVYKPCAKERVKWNGNQIIVLTNRGCFSAANDFAAVMKSLPGVILAGATTGGGGGMPFSSELPNGWVIRFSASPITDVEGACTEFGITPTEGCEVESPDEELIAGTDAILNFAIDKILN